MRIIVIGGGPSGVTAAIKAKNDNNEVIILERNDKILKKLLLTGNGKCNYYNENFSIDDYNSYDHSRIEQIINDKNIWDVRLFFDELGIIPKVKNGYYYPVTNQASTVRDALIYELNQKGIRVFCNSFVSNIEKKEDKFLIHTEERDFYCDKVVLSTGSYAYPKTGSTGAGYVFLQEFGHTIIPPLPALVQLESNFPYCREWDGVRADVNLELYENDERIASEPGEIQLTDYGVSGICVFNLSHIASRGLYEGKKEELHINFVPFINTLIASWMDRYNKKVSSKNLKEFLEGFLNKKIVPIILKCSTLDENRHYNDLNTEEKMILYKNLSDFRIEITGTKGYDNCQICDGGIRLSEIDLDTMESNLVKGLYITGELLDLNGKCGGYNLTTCWISGLIAGKSIGDESDTN